MMQFSEALNAAGQTANDITASTFGKMSEQVESVGEVITVAGEKANEAIGLSLEKMTGNVETLTIDLGSSLNNFNAVEDKASSSDFGSLKKDLLDEVLSEFQAN